MYIRNNAVHYSRFRSSETHIDYRFGATPTRFVVRNYPFDAANDIGPFSETTSVAYFDSDNGGSFRDSKRCSDNC